MGDQDTNHMLSELQEARAEIDRLRHAILHHKWEMRSYKGAFYDEALWLAINENKGNANGQRGE